MFNSSILDIAIGLVFCFAGVGLFTSSIVEFVAAMRKWRHRDLLAGITEMLNDSSYVVDLYHHALINPLSQNSTALPASTGAEQAVSTTQPMGTKIPEKLPAYIPADQFAKALTDVIATVPGDYNKLKAGVANVQNAQLRIVLESFLRRAGDDMQLFEGQMARWFDNGMDRLAGAYKRRTQVWSFCIALVIASILNIDSIHLLAELWRRPALTATITAPKTLAMMQKSADFIKNEKFPVQCATSVVNGPESNAGPAHTTGTNDTDSSSSREGNGKLPIQYLDVLSTLPIGWNEEARDRIWHTDLDVPGQTPGQHFMANLWRAFLFVFGLLITASAALFGAPFWFDLLQRLIQIRGTGTKPLTQRERNLTDARPTRAP